MQANSADRDLQVIRRNGSTTRVWNLMIVFDRHGTSAEHREAPVFQSRRLNRSMIVKHILRPHERERVKRGPRTATKIILPYAGEDLRVGGESFFVRQNNVDRILREAIGGYGEPGSLAWDLETLQLLEALPSLDPFLVRERLRQAGREPARCFFEIAEADVEKMRTFVAREITKLVALAFDRDDVDARALASKLADKLMTDENAQSLEPLRATLRLTGEAYSEGVFAWKGFLYYKWLIGDVAQHVAGFAHEMRMLKSPGANMDERRRLADQRDRILDLFTRKLEVVRAAIREYDGAFDELATGSRADTFRTFLLNAPRRFGHMGENVGIITHIHAFWRFRFPPGEFLGMASDEAFKTFEEFEHLLAGPEAAKPVRI